MLVGVPRLQHLAVTPAMTLSSQHLELKMTYSPSLSLFRHMGHNSHTALEVAKKKKLREAKRNWLKAYHCQSIHAPSCCCPVQAHHCFIPTMQLLCNSHTAVPTLANCHLLFLVQQIQLNVVGLLCMAGLKCVYKRGVIPHLSGTDCSSGMFLSLCSIFRLRAHKS